MFWISPDQWTALSAENTNAYRVGTGVSAWVERFGDDCFISAVSDSAAAALKDELDKFANQRGWSPRRVFYRRLVKQPGESDVPELLAGPPDLAPVVEICERGLRALIDFRAGYSVGWFCDQRENRAWMETNLKPEKVLNCFAYTGAFSLAAARAGAITTSVDLSKKSLLRARENFEVNQFGKVAHRFIADDVFAVLPRLARRGEKYDVIV
ncbi:MAG: class I SAM-dependent methyltransferase, partial [Chthoniobacterales bacterium]